MKLKPAMAKPEIRILTACAVYLLLSSLITGPVSATEKITLQSAQQLVRLKQFDQALHQYTALARNGNTEAMYTLGVLYRNGHGIRANPKLSFKWFRKAARKNHARAQYETAMLYLNGTGTKKDIKKACYHLKAYT